MAGTGGGGLVDRSQVSLAPTVLLSSRPPLSLSVVVPLLTPATSCLQAKLAARALLAHHSRKVRLSTRAATTTVVLCSLRPGPFTYCLLVFV